jgi:hypothetical protein
VDLDFVALVFVLVRECLLFGTFDLLLRLGQVLVRELQLLLAVGELLADLVDLSGFEQQSGLHLLQL